MKKTLALLFCVTTISFAANARSREVATAQTNEGLSGRWTVTVDYHGTTVLFMLTLKQDGGKLTGDFDGDKLEGTQTGDAIIFLAKDDQGGSEDGKGVVQGDTMTGTVVFTNSDDPSHPETHAFTAKRVPPRPAVAPQRHEFVPTTFYRQFSGANAPVLTVNPGDTIHTTTVDAGGADEKGVTRVLGGNPQTGPFYIESAAPGDTLVVHITRLKLNRDWAISDDYLVDRATDRDLAVKMKGTGKSVRWHLDLEKGVATSEKPGDHLAHFKVPLKPMLGCVGVALNPTSAPPGTGDSGRFGGNMDFNEIVEGATVYLPVSVPGALLYVGDGHAAQGDGELNGNALETSMDVEFSVDVIPAKRVPGPRVESADYIIAMGLSGSLDDAFRQATGNMASWLEDQYKLTASETSQVLGTSAEYKVSEVADRNVGMVLKLRKDRLLGIAPAAK